MNVETPLEITCERKWLLKLIWEGIACSDIKRIKYDQKGWEERGKKEINVLPFFNDSPYNPEVIDFSNNQSNSNSCFLH